MVRTGERSVTRRAIYTAFGERINPPLMPSPGGSRYGYCGAWSYESDWSGDLHAASLWGEGFDSPCGEFGGDAAGLVHVGARWYEPATGRFIQRDPIGIEGGFNTYNYVLSNPLDLIDPTGLGFWDGDSWSVHDWVARKFWLPYHSDEHLQSGWATAEAVGLSVVGGLAAGKIAGCALNAALPSSINPSIRIGLHSAHHYFPELGRKAVHLQVNWWRAGVKGSGGVWRHPF